MPAKTTKIINKKKTKTFSLFNNEKKKSREKKKKKNKKEYVCMFECLNEMKDILFCM